MADRVMRELVNPLTEWVYVKPQCTVSELIQVFFKMQNFKEDKEPLVLVTDDRDHVVGIVTPVDILKVVEPTFMKPEYNCVVSWDGLFTQRCRNISDKLVSAIMRFPVIVRLDDNLMKAAHLVNKHGVDTILVVENDRPVGTINVDALFRAVAVAVA